MIQLEVEHDFLQVGVVIGFCGILKLGCLLDVVDFVKLVNFVQVDQWNPLFSVHIYKEDFSLITVSSNDEREDVSIIAMD